MSRHVLYSFILLFLTTGFHNAFGQEAAKISVVANVIEGPFERFYACDSVASCAIGVSLKNQSPDTLCFWLYNCSPSLNFRTNTAQIDFCIEACFRNIPQIYCLLPGQERQFAFPLDIAAMEVKEPFQVGFIYVDVSEAAFGGLSGTTETKEKNKDIIWSDPVTVYRK